MDGLDPLTYFDEEKYIAMVKRESREEGIEYSLNNLMETMNISAEQAMSLLKVPESEQEKYLKALKNNALFQ